jgi:hypothetical protein
VVKRTAASRHHVVIDFGEPDNAAKVHSRSSKSNKIVLGFVESGCPGLTEIQTSQLRLEDAEVEDDL